MNKSDASRRWFGPWRVATHSSHDDPADLGTAFGLDLSLGDGGGETADAARPDGGHAGWMQRLSLRLRSVE